jgi:hypothetical protein
LQINAPHLFTVSLPNSPPFLLLYSRRLFSSLHIAQNPHIFTPTHSGYSVPYTYLFTVSPPISPPLLLLYSRRLFSSLHIAQNPHIFTPSPTHGGYSAPYTLHKTLTDLLLLTAVIQFLTRCTKPSQIHPYSQTAVIQFLTHCTKPSQIRSQSPTHGGYSVPYTLHKTLTDSYSRWLFTGSFLHVAQNPHRFALSLYTGR